MTKKQYSEDDLRRAFLAGVKWWQYYDKGFTMWQSDQRIAEWEAEKRYPVGSVREDKDENHQNRSV